MTAFDINFQCDLIEIVKRYFSQAGISYKDGGDAGDFAARYFEMLIRRVMPVPRRVHFSRELDDSLRRLTLESISEEREKTLEAWNAVFRIWYLPVSGGDLMPYLGKGIRDATTQDGFLWDYGMHHFHLSSGFEKPGVARRSDYLLFAIVSNEDAFLVDVRKHRDPEGLQWVKQYLLRIVHRNWSEITSSRVLNGIQGTILTDQQKKELRRKNVNTVTAVGEVAIAPLGLGTMADGSSAWCRLQANKLLHEIEWHESILSCPPEELRTTLAAGGVGIGEEDFRLVLLESIDASAKLVEHLQHGGHQSEGLYSMGFAILEAKLGVPITVSVSNEVWPYGGHGTVVRLPVGSGTSSR